MKNLIPVALCLGLVLTACSDTPSSTRNEQAGSAHIEWFEGEVDEAFASARSAGRPVFLYWGAEWCPPCHNLKKNVFTHPQFLEAIQSFVPVYLDGDTERAQLWAERYAITGYPSVILFSPTGVELFRMPSDVTAEQYGALLQSAISEFRPVRDILAEVVDGETQDLAQLDLELLAYNAWVQDPSTTISDSEALAAFWRIYSERTDLSERLRARFMALTLERTTPSVWTATPDPDSGALPTLDEQQRASLREGLVALLETRELWPDNKIFLTLQSRRTIEVLEPVPSTRRDQLVEAWLAVAKEIQNHPEYSATEQLMAFVPEFELHALQTRNGDGPIPPSLAKKVRARVEPILAGSSDPDEFQSTLNMLVWLHTMSGLGEEAAALLDEHMNETAAPHYFYSLLGDLSADSPETALEWHRLAFERANQGSARVKWGTAYVLKLIQLAPTDADTIENASRALIDELASSEDAFAGRNHAYLKQVDTALTTWAAETGNGAMIDELRNEFLEQCDRFKETLDETQYERCLAFLDQAHKPS